jgi:hypothetical protein
MKALAGYEQFILYRTAPRAGGGTDKIPVSPATLRDCDAHDASQWIDADTAGLLAQTTGLGVAFVLTDSDPFFCLDLDHCREGDSWAPGAQALAALLPGVALELSHSGQGLHLWGRSAPIEHRTRPVPASSIPWVSAELYTRKRFIALTGTVLAGDASTEVDLSPLVREWFAPNAPSSSMSETWRTEPVPTWRGPTDDDDLLRRAMRAQSAGTVWGSGVSFADLWTANAEALAARWPDPVHGYNASQADAALAAHLAFWTGHNHERMRALMMRSALVRPKWERESYLVPTILNACTVGGEVLRDKEVERPSELPPAPAEAASPAPREGRSILSAAEQAELFRGCVYIRRPNLVYVPGVPYALNQQQFNATFGGVSFLTADGRTCKSAWDAFTASSVLHFPRVDEEGFEPTLPAGAMYRTERGESAVNTYVAPELESREGDVSLWWQHLENLFPDERDRSIFMAWVCAVVRRPGRKIPWAPLLVSGEGTGKTMMFDAIRAAMGGRYTRSVRGVGLVSRFNAWIGRTVLAVAEDFRLPKKDERADLQEKLKELVAGSSEIESEGKGANSENVLNRCNFVFATNQLDTLKIDAGSRRWAGFVIGLWQPGDLLARGMDDAYFVRLLAFLRSREGIAALRHLFLTWPIPAELDPHVTCTRAPATSTGSELIRANSDPVQQIVEEAIISGFAGFRGGWATPQGVRHLLARERLNITPRDAVRLLERLGYQPHPSLENGWSYHNVKPYGTRIRIFCRTDSPHYTLSMPGPAVVRKFEDDQNSALEVAEGVFKALDTRTGGVP